MIQLIEALGYKCLKRIWMPMGAFHILVGPNASGKSTFLDVVALFGDLIRTDVDSAIGRRAGDFRELAWKGERDWFTMAIEVKLPEVLASIMKMAHKDKVFSHCRYQVSIGFAEQASQAQILDETLWLKPDDPGDLIRTKVKTPEDGSKQLRLFEEAISIPEEPPRGRVRAGWMRTVFKTPKGNDYFISEVTGWNAPFRIGPRRMALANVP